MRVKATLCLLLGLLITQTACDGSLLYSAEPIEAWVIDAETKKPLEGVIVTANWELTGGWEGSYPVGQMMVMEAVTDAKGRFYFPGWGPKLHLGQGKLRDIQPQLLVFKSGYHYRNLANEPRGSAVYSGKSEWSGKKIELKPFTGTEQEYAEHVYRLDGNLDRMRDGKECEWTKIPRMLVALHGMREHFDSKGVKLRGWRGGARIRTVLDVGNQRECGLADEIFRSYLQ
jgi:hypothetical protein